jgi:hypothetical protein
MQEKNLSEISLSQIDFLDRKYFTFYKSDVKTLKSHSYFLLSPFSLFLILFSLFFFPYSFFYSPFSILLFSLFLFPYSFILIPFSLLYTPYSILLTLYSLLYIFFTEKVKSLECVGISGLVS